ncbi:hypothetical protein UK23_05445 [Lentzea aerocolonigenes]|uniref:Gram-positive cocci surface proteins LPxTG domain-containing protein n=1 Tax=Lentzea aerocolonigenes TaxID=68170 RepID=A0A0F0HDU9_LENAE|nr:LPXTG cell wall anchor domain-containing protein [Lentzea aerocolonigenes]KJK51828.1 hypothetical protein UK23_05445 [Lentzea aerocolonigenes]
MPRSFAAVAGALFVLIVSTATAHGAVADAGDSRATAHEKSVATCAAAGLAGTTIAPASVQADVKEGTYIDVLDHTGITSVVVVSSSGYNVYLAEKLAKGWADLHAPVDSGRLPEKITAWFACGTLIEPPSSSVTTPPSTTTTTTTPSSSVTATPVPTTTAPASKDELAATGFGSAWLLGLGAALVAAGIAVLMVLRRRRA